MSFLRRSISSGSLEAKFTYVGIRVKDLEESVAFYTGFLGMKVRGRSRFEQTKGDAVSLESPDGKFEIELNHYDDDSPYNVPYVVGEGLDHLAFAVEDLDAALDEARKNGHQVKADIRTDKSRWAFVEDPNGIWVELFKG